MVLPPVRGSQLLKWPLLLQLHGWQLPPNFWGFPKYPGAHLHEREKRSEATKYIEENIGIKFMDLGTRECFVSLTPKSKESIKAK